MTPNICGRACWQMYWCDIFLIWQRSVNPDAPASMWEELDYRLDVWKVTNSSYFKVFWTPKTVKCTLTLYYNHANKKCHLILLEKFTKLCPLVNYKHPVYTQQNRVVTFAALASGSQSAAGAGAWPYHISIDHNQRFHLRHYIRDAFFPPGRVAVSSSHARSLSLSISFLYEEKKADVLYFSSGDNCTP